jgi:hypothetical protein
MSKDFCDGFDKPDELSPVTRVVNASALTFAIGAEAVNLATGSIFGFTDPHVLIPLALLSGTVAVHKEAHRDDADKSISQKAFNFFLGSTVGTLCGMTLLAGVEVVKMKLLGTQPDFVSGPSGAILSTLVTMSPAGGALKSLPSSPRELASKLNDVWRGAKALTVVRSPILPEKGSDPLAVNPALAPA